MAAAEWQLRKCQVKKHQKQLYIYDQREETKNMSNGKASTIILPKGQ
jgi:hypothetical protein